MDAAIIGIGMTTIEKNKIACNYADLAWEAVNKALADASITIDDIDNVITTSSDFWDGRTISCMAVGDACALRHKNCSAVEGDGTFGAAYGLSRTLSGDYKTTLVTAHSKGSESISSIITNAAFDPIYERSLGLDMISASAIQAKQYMNVTGTTFEQLALVSCKNHKNAKDNPYAQLPMDITVNDVLNSEMIAEPLHKLDCSPVSDGCCAIIIANADFVKKVKAKPVWIKGVAFCSDAYFMGDRDLTKTIALENAAKKAYVMAGITNPENEIDIAEIYDAFTYQELMWIEGLGLAEYGNAGKLLEKGIFNRDGKLPVNPSGGLLSGHPVIAAGLYRIAEIVLQIREEAGARQVNAKRGIAHGVNGICGQSHCVWILDKEK